MVVTGLVVEVAFVVIVVVECFVGVMVGVKAISVEEEYVFVADLAFVVGVMLISSLSNALTKLISSWSTVRLIQFEKRSALVVTGLVVGGRLTISLKF